MDLDVTVTRTTGKEGFIKSLISLTGSNDMDGLLPVEADVIFKLLPSTAIVAPVMVIPLAALATSVKAAPNVIATSVPSTTTVNT